MVLLFVSAFSALSTRHWTFDLVVFKQPSSVNLFGATLPSFRDNKKNGNFPMLSIQCYQWGGNIEEVFNRAMIGRLHGTRPRGRPITTWLKDLATQANISYKEAITIPRDRKKWRSVGNPRRTQDEWVSEWVSFNTTAQTTTDLYISSTCINAQGSVSAPL